PKASLAERFCRKNQVSGDDDVVQDLLLVIDVVDEKIQRMNALPQPTVDLCPLPRRNNPWNDVKRKDLFRTSLISIDIERDPHSEQCLFRGLLVAAKFRIANRTNSFK